jgi:hypothetical protein
MPNQSVERLLGAWVRELSLPKEPQSQGLQPRTTFDAAGLHRNEIRLIQKLVWKRQQDIEGDRSTDVEQPLVVSDASWQSFLSRWQEAEKALHINSIVASDLAPHPTLKKVGMSRRWAVNQRWFVMAAGVGALAIGLQLTYSLLQPEIPNEDGVVMRGEEQAQRIVVADAVVAKAKADEAEKQLRDAGVLVRRTELSGGVRIEAKVTPEMLKINSRLRTQLGYLSIQIPEHGRVIVEWVKR